MRPNFLRTIGSITFCVSSTATTMLATTPSIICWRVSTRKSRNGGPALLFTRMSGSGQAASKAAWPSCVATSAATAFTLPPVALRNLGGHRFEPFGIETVDRDLAAGLREREGAGAPEPAARGADDGLAAGNSKVHGDVLLIRRAPI